VRTWLEAEKSGLGGPYHDWNERVTASATRLIQPLGDPQNNLLGIVNNFERSRSMSVRLSLPEASVTVPTLRQHPSGRRPSRKCTTGTARDRSPAIT
jgi:hypothetical protein